MVLPQASLSLAQVSYLAKHAGCSTQNISIRSSLLTIFLADTAVIGISMTRDWNWTADIEEHEYYKYNGRTSLGNKIPMVARAGLVGGGAGDNNIYLFGGTTLSVNSSFTPNPLPDSESYFMWAFDTGLHTWTEYLGDRLGATALSKPNSGASAEAPDQAMAFYIGGQIDAGSSLATQGLGQSFMISGMMVISTSNQSGINVSTAGVSRFPRTRGEAVYLSNVGKYGGLVLLGGIQQSLRDTSFDGKVDLVSQPAPL